VIPLAFNCGQTFCKDCINEQSSCGVFPCPCSTKHKIQSLSINRNIDEIGSEIKRKRIEQTNCQVKKPKKIYITSPLLQDDFLRQTENSQQNHVYIEDRCMHARVETNIKSSQTAFNYILLENINQAKLCVDIKWGKCVVILLYFVFTVPWV
jgi:hypothetical protein